MRVRQPYSARSRTSLLWRSVSGMRFTSSETTWRNRCNCFCRMMWVTARLEYWTSFWRFSTCQIVSGSDPFGIPDVHGEHQRIAPGIVVEHRLHRRVRQDAAIPVELAIDADGRERRRQRAGRHDMAGARAACPAVEVAHLAGAHIGGADCQAGRASVDPVEIDQLVQRRLERRRRIIRRRLGAERHMSAGKRTADSA